MIPCNIHVIATPDFIRWAYVVYIHQCTTTEQVHYVGVCELSKLFTLEDAQANSQWANKFKGNENVEIKVVGLTTDQNEAITEQRRLIQQHQPYCNMRGYHVGKKYQQVRCNETGERFRNASDASKAHGLSLSALYQHLQRKPGHKTVKGRTYDYIPPFAP